MKKKLLCALLCCALLLASLTGCGRGGGQTPPEASPSLPSATPSAAQMPAPPAEAPTRAFPLLSAPLGFAESQEMINHNARRCALLIEDAYYLGELFSDGSRALVRYEVIDNRLHHRRVLVRDCAAEALCAWNGQLCFLGADGRVERVNPDGSGHAVFWEEPCDNLQLWNGTLLALTKSGALVDLSGGEMLLYGCRDAFATSAGIFFVSLSDGRAHLYDSESKTDLTLTGGRAAQLTLIGTRLYYVTDEPDGRRLCALDLMTGEEECRSAPFTGPCDFYPDENGVWQVRLGGRDVAPLDGVFDASVALTPSADGPRRLRALDDPLRTEELLGPDGESLGFAFVLPYGLGQELPASGNKPEK